MTRKVLILLGVVSLSVLGLGAYAFFRNNDDTTTQSFTVWPGYPTISTPTSPATTSGTTTSPTTASSGCPSVDVVFARGTGEPAGLGSVGRSFVGSLRADLHGVDVDVYAVDYAAAEDQVSVGEGSTDLIQHVTGLAAICPHTKFVLGGYSQGASVIDLATGVFGPLAGSPLPTSLAARVDAVVVFGNPLGLTQQTIETASDIYRNVAKSYCAEGDPVCGSGIDFSAHGTYVSNGSTANGARFAADRLS